MRRACAAFGAAWLALVAGMGGGTMTFSASEGPSVRMSCTVDGRDIAATDVVRRHVCGDIATELATRLGRRSVVVVDRSAGKSGAWVHFEVRIVSVQAVRASASWGRNGTILGRSPEITAGIDDAPPNRAFAQTIARSLAVQIPTIF